MTKVYFYIGFISFALLACSVKATETSKEIAIPVAEAAQNHYMEFLNEKDMYAFTAAPAYPRGDSRTKYAMGDCTGDGIPELHLSFGINYHIYTFQEGEVNLLRDFDLGSYPMVTPAKNGAIVVSKRIDNGPDTLKAMYRIPSEDDPFSEMGRIEGSVDYYGYWVLDEKGDPIESKSLHITSMYQKNQGLDEYIYRINDEDCTESEWNKAVELCREIEKNQSEQLEWNYVFPKEEWDYLDAMEEGNGLPEHGGGTEWSLYKRVLSGDFSFLEMEERLRFDSAYKSSLDPSTGRSQLKYILQDFNGDGVDDLFIQYDPNDDNYTSPDFSYDNISKCIGFLTYTDKKAEGWISDGITGVRFIPLENGQMIQLESYAVTTSLYLGRISPKNKIWLDIEKEYTLIDVNLQDDNSHYNKEWYKQWYGSDREFEDGETLYFLQEYRDERLFGESRELSPEAWNVVEEMIGELLIPDREWKPASVFLPNRNPASYSQG